ncbi:hypothetical protein [Geobacillus subterraneus]|uniref:hypothetical protein n=1 Tax=Geobacillus subterraneus TaxID=129338 RepID=UPI00161AEFD1
MKLTGNLGLKKPEGTDVVNIDDLNQNFDILDVEIVKVASPTQNGRMSAADKVKLDGIDAGAQRNTVTSVNNKTGAVILAATDVGAETPAGAQTKANQAEANAKAYADQQLASHSADYVKHITAAERAAWNSAEANAKAYTDSAPEPMQRNLGNFNVYKSEKDSNGIFTVVEYKRPDGTLYAKSVLSGGTSPQYTTRTITYYAADGTTVIRTDPYTLVYDADGDLISEVKQ